MCDSVINVFDLRPLKLRCIFLLDFWISNVQMFESISMKYYSKSTLTKTVILLCRSLKNFLAASPVCWK